MEVVLPSSSVDVDPLGDDGTDAGVAVAVSCSSSGSSLSAGEPSSSFGWSFIFSSHCFDSLFAQAKPLSILCTFVVAVAIEECTCSSSVYAGYVIYLVLAAVASLLE